MNAPPGYILMNCADVLHRCKILIDEIHALRKEEDDIAILDYIKSKNYLSFLPGWKPLTRKNAKEHLELSWFFPSIASWGTLGEAEELLEAAQATKSDIMWISVGSYILSCRFSS